MSSDNNFLANWIPGRLIRNNTEIAFRWLYTGNVGYDYPFFDETISRCRHLPENIKGYQVVSTDEMVIEWAKTADTIPPVAFIFHVSRCGSTLVSQALGMLPGIVSLSEVPVFDEILRLSLGIQAARNGNTDELFMAVVRLYGRRRLGTERRMVVKTDSWHLLFWRQIRQMYPHVPFVLLYRRPGEVLDSNRRKPGIQGIHSIVPPEVYGFTDLQPSDLHPDMYFARALERFYECILDLAANDNRLLLVNYNEGLLSVMHRIAGVAGIVLSPEDIAAITERGAYHAKKPQEPFVETNADSRDHPLTDRLEALYEQIEAERQLRVGIW